MRTVIFACLLVMLMAGRAWGVTIADSEHHFSFDTPESWVESPQNALDAMKRLTGQVYIHGAHRENTTVPYCAVQAFPGPPNDPASHMDELRAGIEKAATRYGATVGDVTFDARRNAVIALMRIHTPEGTVQCISYLFFGKQEAIAVHCYARAQDFASVRPEFEQMANSFKFESGYGDGPWLTPNMKVWLGAGACLVIGTFMAVGIARKENRTRQAESF